MSCLWKTVRKEGNATDWIAVHGFKDATSGVLKGQTIKHYLGSYPTLERAVQAHPEVLQDGQPRWGSKWSDPVVSLGHLPGEDDPVPGGMYPDDI